MNLDGPIEVWVNGTKGFSGRVSRSALTALSGARARGDERLIDAAEITVTVPSSTEAMATGERAFNALAPKQVEGTLSFWEMFATRALEERVPTLGLEGTEETLPAGVEAAPEQVAVRAVAAAGPLSAAGLKPGDLLVEFSGEPFFRGRGAVAGLHQWLIRELRAESAPYVLIVWRDGRRLQLNLQLKLGPYAGS